jgi:hypothetical protein
MFQIAPDSGTHPKTIVHGSIISKETLSVSSHKTTSTYKVILKTCGVAHPCYNENLQHLE